MGVSVCVCVCVCFIRYHSLTYKTNVIIFQSAQFPNSQNIFRNAEIKCVFDYCGGRKVPIIFQNAEISVFLIIVEMCF